MKSLAFEEGPPLAFVLRAFLAASGFWTAAGVVLFAGGPWVFTQRYAPDLLAATHLVTIGFLMMVMTAAVWQLLPVLSGTRVPALARLAPIVQGGFGLGAILLASAFIAQSPGLFGAAGVLLAVASAAFVLPLGVVLVRRVTEGALAALAASLVGFAVAWALGVWLALARAHGHWPDALRLTLHPLFALAGGFFVLWTGIAWQVLPMFQGSRAWSRRLTTALGPALMMLLAATAVAACAHLAGVERGLLGAVTALIAAHAAFILARLHTRVRKRRDAMALFWYGGLASLLGACCVAAVLLVTGSASERLVIALGVLAIPGATVSFMSGMIYKIVPFLVWLLQLRAPRPPALLMQDIIRERRMQEHFAVHSAAVIATLVAIVVPGPLAFIAALLWTAAGCVLARNLVSATVLYRRAWRASGG